MKKKAYRFIALIAAFCIAFSGLPFLAGNLDVHAASKKAKVAKKITLQAKATGETTASLSWNKVKKPQKGYAVFRNGVAIAHVGKKLSFNDKGLEPGTTYKYQIKVYKTKKKTEWLNKKTGKWQAKKPAKKYRGKSRKTTVYTYQNPSNQVSATTALAYYSITWKDWDGKTLRTDRVVQNSKPAYNGTPTRKADDKYTYTFTGWSPSISVAAGNKTYTAQYKSTAIEVPSYTITWKNWDGTVLLTEDLQEGATPSYKGTPTRAEDADNTYTFTGWSPAIASVSKNCEYTAQFKATAKPAATFTITWQSWDGSVLKKDTVKKGATPSYSGTPTRPEDDEYTYEFSGWSPSIAAATADAVYKAQFTASKKSQYTYDIKFINEPYGNGGTTVVYLKTDNPNAERLAMNVLDENGNALGNYSIGIPNDYDDVEFTDPDEYYVKGGILTSFKPAKAGKLTFAVYEEKIQGSARIKTKVASKTVQVRDYAAEEKAWRQFVIDSATTSDMTNKEKMQAICGYILKNFKYFPNYNGQYIGYIATKGIPYWIIQEGDSALTPAILVDFGNDLNYPLENLFGKYKKGTAEWTQYHMCAYSAADDYYYKACPPSDTNSVNPKDIKMFDPDTFKFWGE